MHPATPIPPAPPTTMRFATGLLFVVGGLVVLREIVDLVFTNTGLSLYKDAYNGDVGSGFGSLVGMTVALFVAGVVVSLAIMNSHGAEKARITTFVLSGIFLVCGGWGNLSDGFHRPVRSVGGGAFARILPAGYGVLTSALDVLVVLVLVASLVLLALPPSTRFFHGRRPVGYVTIPVYQAPGLHPLTPPPSAFSTPLPQQSPSLPPSLPPPPPPEPHSASIPMADPWAEYQPRHGGETG